MSHFRDLLQTAIQRSDSTLAIGIVPRVDQLPTLIQRYDDPFLPLGRAIIDVTNDLVAAYVFHLGAYLSTGAAGAIALERTIAYVPDGVIKIIHAPFASADFVRAVYENAFGADAITLATTEQEIVTAYVQDAAHGVFINEQTSNMPLDIAAEFPDQVGVYRAVSEAHNALLLSRSSSTPTLHWRWGTDLFTSRGEDFGDKLRALALQLRRE